jgi:hypothetical protein
MTEFTTDSIRDSTETTQQKLDRLHEEKIRHEARGEWAGDFGEEEHQRWRLEAADMLPDAMSLNEDLAKRLKEINAAIVSLPAWTGVWEPVTRIKEAADLTKQLAEYRANGKEQGLTR